MIKVWGRTNSVNVKKVLWCLEELRLPYERIDAGMQYGVVDTPEYRRLNPNGLVPTIEDGDFVLWESHAIVRYLAASYGKGVLWPREERARAIANQWMDWTFTLQAALRPVFWGLVRTPPEARDPAAIEDGRRRTAQLLDILDGALADRAYLAGVFSMAEIVLGCHVHLWMRLPIERPAHPNVRAWFARLVARPAFRKVVDLPLS
ncbi:MAG: glutathione S-transferase family protein [Burkholderiales bacterium]|nr:glutathione S-transferase family protein [Burkholderiales bacterium]